MTASNYRSPEGERLAMARYEETLARWPVALAQHYVETTVGPTFVISRGDPAAPPLVLLHGSVSNASSWGIDAEAYGARFHVHAIDLPGDAGKSTPARPPYGRSTVIGSGPTRVPVVIDDRVRPPPAQRFHQHQHEDFVGQVIAPCHRSAAAGVVRRTVGPPVRRRGVRFPR